MTAPDTVPPHPRIVTTPAPLRRNEVVSRGVTAPRLTVTDQIEPKGDDR